jgi:hypothetical protein
MSGTKRERGAEACAVGLCTEKPTDYSGAPGRHDEPEGTFPGGRSTCVEPDRVITGCNDRRLRGFIWDGTLASEAAVAGGPPTPSLPPPPKKPPQRY